jgi:hypothetical protein
LITNVIVIDPRGNRFSRDEGGLMTLEEVWDRLLRVRSLSFVARSAKPTGWNGRGSGTVVVEPAGDGVLTFTESGSWRPAGGRDLRFRNAFRWSMSGEAIGLEHLRFGADHPVCLFDLASAGDLAWRSVSPHLCGEDCYSAEMLLPEGRILLRWAVTGPKKQEEIEYTYSW